MSAVAVDTMVEEIELWELHYELVLVSSPASERHHRIGWPACFVGADDYIVKPFDSDELLARVRAALRRVRAEPNNNTNESSSSSLASLTAREREVLRLLAAGVGQAEIAATLVISQKTVGGHIQRILTKLGVHSRAQAVALAHREGFMDVEAHELSAA